MKKKSLILAVVFSAMLFSCNNSTQTGQTKAADTTATADTTTTQPAPPAVFTPFDIVRVQFRVKNYDKWYEGFLSRDSMRVANGIHKYVVDRGLNADSNMVMVVSKIDDIQKTKAFYNSPVMKAAMAKSGIIGTPKFAYLNVIRNDTSQVPQDQRVSVTHHVKNFDAWLKVYDGEGKDARAANGTVDRAMARGIEDTNVVSVVFIVTDMAKAKARIASPELKKLMTDAGVDGPPEITWYRVVQKF